MPIQTKLTTTLAALIATSFAATAFAQDSDMSSDIVPEVAAETPEADAAVILATFDSDGDGVINMDEFTTLVVASADAGDDDARQVVLSGDYAGKFASHDADMDGLLSADEIASGAHDTPESDDEIDTGLSDEPAEMPLNY